MRRVSHSLAKGIQYHVKLSWTKSDLARSSRRMNSGFESASLQALGHRSIMMSDEGECFLLKLRIRIQ